MARRLKVPAIAGGGVRDEEITTVWKIPTQSFKEHHYATFPEKLPSICIRAGTSEWGCCPKCGAPWVRVVEKTGGSIKNIGNGENLQGDRKGPNPRDYDRLKIKGAGGITPMDTKTLGFKPSCDCPDNRPVPCIVLDPFMGSGTTGKVAQDLHRDYIGFDIGFKDLSNKRTHQPSLI